MVKVEINPARIERVVIEATYEVERRFDTATLVLITPLLRRIDRELKRHTRAVLREDEERRLRAGLRVVRPAGEPPGAGGR